MALDSNTSGDQKPQSKEEKQRRAATLWYEHFEKKRVTKTSPRRQKIIQQVLIFMCFLMVIGGLVMRSDKISTQLGEARLSEEAIIAKLTTELKLDSESSMVFFPLLNEYRRETHQIIQERSQAISKLKEVSRKQTEHNKEIDLQNNNIVSLDANEARIEQEFILGVGEKLGQWRSARLRLMEKYWKTGHQVN
jgi:hypothetical protein